MAEPKTDSAPACEYLNVHEDILKASNLVRFRREGKTVFYSLDDEHVRSVLALGMEHVLEK